MYLSGQVARDAQGQRSGEGDPAAKVEQAYLNVGTALAPLGGTFDDVAELTHHVVDWEESRPAVLGEGVGGAAQRLGISPGEPDLMIEVEAVAVPARLPGAGDGRADRKSAPGRIRTCAPASGGQCSIP